MKKVDDEKRRISLGKKIREIRKNIGFTQEVFSEIVGIETTTLSCIETGRNFPSFQTLNKIAQALDVTFSELFEEDAPNTKPGNRAVFGGVSHKVVLKKIGLNFRAERVRKKYSQEKLAEIAGVHLNYIGKIERGEQNLTIKTITELANALEVEIGKILNF